jgi:hypothetical protein
MVYQTDVRITTRREITMEQFNSTDMIVLANVFVTGLSSRTLEAIAARTIAAQGDGVRFSEWSRYGLYLLAVNSPTPQATVVQINTAAKICELHFWTREETLRVLGPESLTACRIQLERQGRRFSK